MALAILILVILVSLAHLVDFILGPRGQRRIKDRLVDFYVMAAESDWTNLLRLPAFIYNKYLIHFFGTRLWSLKFIWRSVLYSAIITTFVYVFELALNIPTGIGIAGLAFSLGPSDDTLELREYITAALVNVFFDIITIQFAIKCTSLLVVTPPAKLIYRFIAWSIGAVIIYLTSFGIHSSLETLVMLFDDRQSSLSDLLSLSATMFINPYEASFEGPGEYIDLYALPLLPSVQIVIPFVTFWLATLGTLLIVALRPVVKTPLLIVLERLEGVGSGAFTSLAAVLSAALVLITAFVKWMGG